MSLAERLEQARRGHVGANDVAGERALPSVSSSGFGFDPFARVKESVHQALIGSLGPQLYDPHLEQSDLEQRVRLTLQSVIESEDTPLSAADRTRIAQDVSDEILGHRLLSLHNVHFLLSLARSARREIASGNLDAWSSDWLARYHSTSLA